MNVCFEKTFEKDLKKIVDKTLKAEINKAILSVEEACIMRDIPKLIKMVGYKVHYRIRVGKYRIGVTIVGNLVTFEACLPRKDFYKYFP